MTELLQDKGGKVSSKRIAGYIGLGVMCFVSVWHVVKGGDVSRLMWPWAVFVGAVFGVTVLEKK